MDNKDLPALPLKIFELRFTNQGEKEWICAYTNIQALKVYIRTCDVNFHEFDERDEIVEVPREKWKELHIKNTDYDDTDPDDWKLKSFDEYMKDQVHPDIIAGTMYE